MSKRKRKVEYDPFLHLYGGGNAAVLEGIQLAAEAAAKSGSSTEFESWLENVPPSDIFDSSPIMAVEMEKELRRIEIMGQHVADVLTRAFEPYKSKVSWWRKVQLFFGRFRYGKRR